LAAARSVPGEGQVCDVMPSRRNPKKDNELSELFRFAVALEHQKRPVSRAAAAAERDTMDRNTFWGGNPLAVIVRLVILSIIVGVVLSALNIRPDEIFYHIRRLMQWLYELGFDSIEKVVSYFLIGAVVVIPIWFIARLFGMFGGKSDDGRR
jgi:hypothetical protein